MHCSGNCGMVAQGMGIGETQQSGHVPSFEPEIKDGRSSAKHGAPDNPGGNKVSARLMIINKLYW